MSSPQVTTGDRIIDPMIALAGCSTRQRIVVAGSKSMELMLELHRRGYLLAAAAGNCGHPTGQYDVALVDWRRRTLHALETTMYWLVNFLSPCAVLVTCENRGCYASTPVTPEPLTALKSGKQLKVSFQDLAKETIAVPMPLNDFAAAYDKIK
jgi:hypothetical protein